MYVYTYIHSYIHTCMHAYIHTYIHTHTHTQLAKGRRDLAGDMDYMIKELDKDGDGQIDYEEMKTGFCC